MKKKLILYFILYFCFSICINVVHPVTPSYVDSLALPEAYFGIFFSLMALGQVIGALLFGFISDKVGRKWLIVIGILGYCLAQAGFGYINKYPIFILIFRFLSGLFSAAPTALFVSMCLDFSSKEENVKNLSILSFCSILGGAVGYEIGGSLHTYLHFTIQHVFLTQIVLGVITATLFAIFIKDVKKETGVKEETTSSQTTTTKQKKKPLNGLIVLFLVGLLILNIGQILINKYFDPFVINSGFESAFLGHYVFITGIIAAISNLFIIPLIKKAKDKQIGILLTSFIGVSAILTFITFLVKVNFIYLLFSSHLVYIIIKALIMPLEQNELATYSNGHNNGQIMGARQTILSIGKVIGPLLGSVIYVKGSPLIFIISASIILFALVLFIIYYIIKNVKEKKALEIKNDVYNDSSITTKK